MIKKVQLTNFKRFSSTTVNFKEKGVSILVGGNNSGKSTLLHAMAVWEFAKIYLENEKGAQSLHENFHGDGIGIGLEDFTPINIPSLKYLWTNLNYGGVNGGYSLKIKCTWDLPLKPDRQLEISFALTQERLFIKPTFSNLSPTDKVPVVAYLPPFAGITDREQWYSPADRKKLIGRGLAGSVLRNTIMEMYMENVRARREKKGVAARIPKSSLALLKSIDPFEVLNRNLLEVFSVNLYPHHFSPQFHNYVKIDLAKGQIVHQRFKPFPNYTKRDIMVEGSGFLQWLSVYAYAINNEIDLLLLDEPDAHLHCSLQNLLLDKLIEICKNADKQILLASHSTELIKYVHTEQILEVKGNTAKYLQQDNQKTAVIAGLGSEYSPIINKLQRSKRLIFTENKSDIDLLKIWCEKLQIDWPQRIVEWPFANNHDQRKQLFLHIKEEIKDLKGLSVEDRDNDLYEQTTAILAEKYPDWTSGNAELRYRRWRRWEIENYLICPSAIARAANVDEKEIRDFLCDSFSMIVPAEFHLTERKNETRTLFDLEGKSIMDAIESKFGVSKYDVANSMLKDEVFEDIKTLLNEIVAMCSN